MGRRAVSALTLLLLLAVLSVAVVVVLYLAWVGGLLAPVATKTSRPPAVRLLSASLEYNATSGELVAEVSVYNAGPSEVAVDAVYVYSAEGEVVALHPPHPVVVGPGSSETLRVSEPVTEPPRCPCRVVVSAGGVEASAVVPTLSVAR